MNYKEEIKKLIDLQEMDAEIYDLRSQLEVFPTRIKEMDDSLETKKGGMEAADEALKMLQVSKNEKEMDMQDKEEKIKKHESELYLIKNNKEYTALKHEIDSIKADVSLVEEDIITLFDEIEAAQSRCAEEKKIFEEETQQVEKEKQVIKGEEKQLTERVNSLASQRAEVVSAIDPALLGRYEAILESRGRIALTKVTDEFCGGCNMHLRPQIINEATLKKNIVVCENCSRILYAEE